MASFTLQRSNARAEIYPQGAHLARYEIDGEPVLFLSERAVFAPGKAIRGGIPVCFPWFGQNAAQPSLPSHGFARTSDWEVAEKGEEWVVMTLASSEATRILWPHDFAIRYRVQLLEKGLLLDFQVQNTGETSFTFETALHTYFSVSEVREVEIEGLDGKTYIDEADEFRRKVQRGEIRFEGETDRLYLDSGGPVRLRDGARTVRLTGIEGWRSTVVWNPWTEKARSLKDLGEDQFPGFVCVETGFAADDAVTLAAGEVWRLAVEIEVMK